MTPATSSYVATKEQRRRRDLIHLNSVRSPAANYVLVYLKAAGAEMPTTLVNGGQYMAKRGRRRMTSFDRREEAFEARAYDLGVHLCSDGDQVDTSSSIIGSEVCR
jgi:hypothetical protein